MTPKDHCHWDIESMRKQFEPSHYATNRMIAKFMGYINTTPTDKDFNIFEHPREGIIINGKSQKMMETRSMQFHSSWEWLMVVYQKICNLPSTGDRPHPPSGPLGIFSNIKYQIPYLDKTYLAIVEFIKYYNSHGERTNG